MEIDSSNFRITEFEVQNKYFEYWFDQHVIAEEALEKIRVRKNQSKNGTLFTHQEKDILDRLLKINNIVESLSVFVTGICEILHVQWRSLVKSDFAVLYDTIIDMGVSPAQPYNRGLELTKARLQSLVNRIKPKSYSDPRNPEFPIDNPKFPATETIKLSINGKDVWIKDESSNPTGTHKDRMAWEVLLYYKRKIQSILNTHGDDFQIPQLSMISSGSSAIAIQSLLNYFGLPPLKVLIRNGFKQEIYNCLNAEGCELYIKDLTIKELDAREVLRETENLNGIEVSFRDAIDPTQVAYYDWMSYEILNVEPSVVIVPFGSGELFTNILNVSRNEVVFGKNDSRFLGTASIIRRCKFFGITTSNPNSKYFKLCSYFFNVNKFNTEQMSLYKRLDVCHPESRVVDLSDDFFDEAKDLLSRFGVKAEDSSVAGLAFYLENQQKFDNERKVLIVNTGRSKCS